MGNVQPKQKPQEDEESEFTCQICFEPAQSSTNKFKNSTLCRHPFCLECITSHIEARVSEGEATIICPGLNCNHPLDPLSCQDFVPKTLFNKWCHQLCELAVLKVNKCYCPYKNCSTLVLNECGGTVRKTTCPNCKRVFCFVCKVPWHAGYWCRESHQRGDQNEVLFRRKLEEKKWLRCRKCGHAIEKNGGCYVVTCRCGSMLCRDCGRLDHPLESCKHRLPGREDQAATCLVSCCMSLVMTILMLSVYVLVNKFQTEKWLG